MESVNVQVDPPVDPTIPPQNDPPPARKFADKYETVEDLEKGYKELESFIGKKFPDGVPKNDPPATPPSTPATPESLDFDRYFNEFMTNNRLSEDSYTKLEKSGIPRAVVDAYIKGQQRLAKDEADKMYTIVGGEAKYGEMIQWAAGNLSKEEIEAYNTAIGGAGATMAIQGLFFRYSNAAGKSAPPSPNPILGDNTPATGDVYRSKAELTKDMNDERYKKDPAFRRDVMERLGRSSIM